MLDFIREAAQTLVIVALVIATVNFYKRNPAKLASELDGLRRKVAELKDRYDNR